MRALDDDYLVDRALVERGQDGREQEALLGPAEARGLAGREDDRCDQDSVTVTVSISTVCVGCCLASPSVPIRSTTSRPFEIVPTTA